jgi:hypothetical protein
MARRVERRDARGRLLTAYTAEDEQFVNGIWFPMRVAETEYVDDEGEPKVKSERVMTITDVSLNLTLSHDEFKLILPPGAMVIDCRWEPTATYETARTPPEPPTAKVNAAEPTMP